ncbi:type VI secretion system baseplate subunit TssG [Roseibium sediminicola]|uniref:Type VI secretion system baseplate subunit TssG n=1 Tax=Roseibium sediminicola TaxID=2933272 RepID=A0ABT0GV13_9HYPH|nr:type VI secretion system baseplate subunit TssG [Roseibium sp. CAU 1639]MCK7613276.1 type VI secretion system baseplate subunit TssG [Roseibium sp. CAU 1639]
MSEQPPQTQDQPPQDQAEDQPPPDAMLVGKLARTQFFQALYLIGLLHPEVRHMGPGHDPEKEVLRFRATRSLSFGPSDVSSIDYDPEKGLYDVRVNFFGLYGPASPLPPYVTERIIERDETPSSLEDLLDLFNHRFISLLHSMWQKSRHFVRFEEHGLDATSQCFLALCGFPVDDRAQLGNVPRTAILPHVGLMSHYSNSPDAIASLLSSYFDLPFEIIEFITRTVEIPPEARMELGIHNTILGGDMVLGEEVEDDLGKFRLRIGPAPYDVLQAFLPNGEKHAVLVDLLAMIVRDPIDWDLEFSYQQETIQAGQLGSARLGNNLWLSDGENANLENNVHLAPARPSGTVPDENQGFVAPAGMGGPIGVFPVEHASSSDKTSVTA